MRTVFTVGVYDLLHVGHILLFKRAKELGDRLVVAVQDSTVIKKYKPSTNIINNTDVRQFMVQSIRYVDQAIVYYDVDEIIKTVDFDVFVVGPDQVHSGFVRAMEWCRIHNKEVVVLPRTEGISSSILRDYIDKQ